LSCFFSDDRNTRGSGKDVALIAVTGKDLITGPKDLGLKDLDLKDLGPKDLDPKDLDPKDLDPKDLGLKDLGPKDEDIDTASLSNFTGCLRDIAFPRP
jgi:hypothetical protein